jgi:hypothetical protein
MSDENTTETEFDRSRGGLTNSDRKFIATQGESLKKDASSRQKLWRVKRRVRAQMTDYRLLLKSMSDEHGFKLMYPSSDDEMYDELRAGMESAVGLFISLVYRRGVIEGGEQEGREAVRTFISDSVARTVERGESTDTIPPVDFWQENGIDLSKEEVPAIDFRRERDDYRLFETWLQTDSWTEQREAKIQDWLTERLTELPSVKSVDVELASGAELEDDSQHSGDGD